MSTGSSRWLAGIAALIVVLVIASVLIALFGSGTTAPDYPADSPEGVVQSYVRAINASDPSLVLSYMEAEAREGCTVQEVTQQTQYIAESPGRRRIELVDSRELSDGRRQVELRITEVNVSPPFDVSEFSYEEWLTLVDEDGDWVIEYPSWPINWCRELQDEGRVVP